MSNVSKIFFMAAWMFAVEVSIHELTGLGVKGVRISRLEYLMWYSIPLILGVIGWFFRKRYFGK